MRQNNAYVLKNIYIFEHTVQNINISVHKESIIYILQTVHYCVKKQIHKRRQIHFLVFLKFLICLIKAEV